MPTRTFTSNTGSPVSFGVEARSDAGYRLLSYSGDLGGGTLRVFTQCGDEADIVPVSDSKLTEADVDDNGDAIQQMTFISAGNVLVELSGATDPDCKVTIA